jgi:hypothetical protein
LVADEATDTGLTEMAQLGNDGSIVHIIPFCDIKLKKVASV